MIPKFKVSGGIPLSILAVFHLAVLSGCATFGKGMFAGSFPDGPLEEGTLRHHCDLKDPAACLLLDGSEPEDLPRLPIVQGGAPSDRALFSIASAKNSKVSFYLFDRQSKTIRKLPELSKTSHSSLGDEIIQIAASPLKPGVTYGLLVTDPKGTLLDYRTFQTQKPSNDSRLRFALVSCTDDRIAKEQTNMWRQLLAEGPDLILSLGDNVYADWREGRKLTPYAQIEDLWFRYLQTRKSLAVFYSPHLVPFIAVWDDHDFGMNDGDQTYPHKEAAREIFEAFFPFWSDDKELKDGPGIARYFKVAGQNFLLLDGRSFRTPNSPSPACAGRKHSLCREPKTESNGGKEPAAHFGRVQEDWAFRLLSKNEGPFWFMNGVQWFGAYQPFESFEGNHPAAFRAFLQQTSQTLRQKPAGSRNSLVFASGDRHLAELMKVKLPGSSKETWEITSSGLHARTFPSSWGDFPNPRKLEGASGQLNYMIVDSERRPNGSLGLEIVSKGPEGVVLFRRSALIEPLF